jgi:hypothetical protein
MAELKRASPMGLSFTSIRAGLVISAPFFSSLGQVFFAEGLYNSAHMRDTLRHGAPFFKPYVLKKYTWHVSLLRN